MGRERACAILRSGRAEAPPFPQRPPLLALCLASPSAPEPEVLPGGSSFPRRAGLRDRRLWGEVGSRAWLRGWPRAVGSCLLRCVSGSSSSQNGGGARVPRRGRAGHRGVPSVPCSAQERPGNGQAGLLVRGNRLRLGTGLVAGEGSMKPPPLGSGPPRGARQTARERQEPQAWQ